MQGKGTFSGHLAVIASIAALTSCTSPYWQPKVHFAPGDPKEILGVKQLLENPRYKEVDVISIHGMCTHDGKWARGEINDLAKQLGKASEDDIKPLKVINSNAVVYKRTLDFGEKKVNISALVWSPIMTPLKRGLCYDQKIKTGLCAQGKDERPDFLTADIDSPKFDEDRATINRLGKDTLMDDCLADAMAYQGKAREGISRQVQEAILYAAIPSNKTLTPEQLRTAAVGRKDFPLIIITSSLGSKIGFDAIDALNHKDKPNVDAAKTTVVRTANIFMAANQWPILQLADQTIEGGAGEASFVSTPTDSLSKLLHDYENEIREFQAGVFRNMLVEQEKKQPTVIVLSDPNDILSYSWRNSPQRPDYKTVDVVVSNQKTWFNLLENPATAHRGYLTQPYVSNIIMNGYSEK
ncbi:TPA: hypothetical protein ACLEB8_004845 [Pseudomonas aeruginosa]